MIDIYQLKNLAAFAECGTLSAAAEKLNTSQPSLTRSMASLEREMGAPLFDRAKNKIALNANGRLALAYANAILAQLDEMQRRVAENDRASRTVLIGTVAPAPAWVLQESQTARAFFGESFGARKIEFEIADEAALFKGIESRKYEFVVLPYSAETSPEPEHAEKYTSRKVCEENLCFSLPANHKFANRKSLRFSEMNGESFIVFSEIGFWDKIHRENLPDSKFLVQSDKFTLEELTRNSVLPHFVTDLSLKHFNRPVENKALVPIADAAAHAEFFLWTRK